MSAVLFVVSRIVIMISVLMALLIQIGDGDPSHLLLWAILLTVGVTNERQ